MHLIYNISIYFYLLAIRLASLFNPKAKLWIKGRENIFDELKAKIKSSVSNSQGPSNIVWVHCASLGEFEQGRPLIDKIRNQKPGIKILLTFFSPSGYQIRKNYKGADFVFYLPLDTTSNAKQFIDIIKPSAVFFIKYEFWFNYLEELKRQNISTFLVSGIFRKDHYFFKFYGSWFRKQLNCFTRFFVQDESSKILLNSISYENVSVVGDTRFDRVSEISKNVISISLIEQFIQNSSVFIGGSTWPEDEKLIAEWCKDSSFQTSGFKLIIAPHEINEDHIQSIIQLFAGFSVLRFSSANEQNIKQSEILIIDNIGMLSSIYQYGTIAFIGGGFGRGIHNILEAATFGLPVIFGPNYQKFTEAKELIQSGGAFSVSDKNEFIKTISLLKDSEVLKTASHISKYYVESRIGATDRILDAINLKGW
jgi:3-deoxy-D-manno-octulosonic-acid transferase